MFSFITYLISTYLFSNDQLLELVIVLESLPQVCALILLSGSTQAPRIIYTFTIGQGVT